MAVTFGCNYFPQRYILAFISFLGVAIFYFLRTSLRTTLRKLSSPYNLNSINGSRWIQCDECFEKLHKLSDQEQEQILVTFYYGYILCHVPGAILIKRFGVKIIFGLGAATTSILALLLPYAACYSKYTLIAVRISMGISMSVFYPSCADLLARWAPSREVTLLYATMFGGLQVGMVSSWTLPWFLLDRIKWQNMYIILGVIGIIWCLFWSIFCYDSPNSHPYIKSAERNFLNKYIPEINDQMPTPWMDILKSKPVWALTIGWFGHAFGFYTLIANLPKYYKDDSKISYSNNGDLAVMPFLLMWLASVLLGFLSDKIIYLKWTTTTHLRRSLAVIGAVGPGIGMVSASYLYDKVSKVIIITMFMSSMSFTYCSVGMNVLDLTRSHTAMIMALANCGANIAGILVPAVVNAVLTRTEHQRQWQEMFWIIFTVSILAILPFMMWGSGELQPWDKPIKERPCSNLPRLRSNKNQDEEERNGKQSISI